MTQTTRYAGVRLIRRSLQCAGILSLTLFPGIA
jgi:hypothetical protein